MKPIEYYPDLPFLLKSEWDKLFHEFHKTRLTEKHIVDPQLFARLLKTALLAYEDASEKGLEPDQMMGTGGYDPEPYPTPQKPEPSGEFPRLSSAGLRGAKEVARQQLGHAPSPSVGCQCGALEGQQHTAWCARLIKSNEYDKLVKASEEAVDVANVKEAAAFLRSNGNLARAKSVDEAAEALTKLSQERDGVTNLYNWALNAKIKAEAERDALSAQVQRLKEGLDKP